MATFEKDQALLVRDLEHHVEVCGDRYKNIDATTREIKQAQADASKKMDSSVARLHTRQDETNNALATMEKNILVAIEAGKGKAAAQGVGLKVWVLGGLFAAIPTVLSIIAFMQGKTP